MSEAMKRAMETATRKYQVVEFVNGERKPRSIAYTLYADAEAARKRMGVEDYRVVPV